MATPNPAPAPLPQATIPPSTLKRVLTLLDSIAALFIASGQLPAHVSQALGAVCAALTYLGYGDTKAQLARLTKAATIALVVGGAVIATSSVMSACSGAQRAAGQQALKCEETAAVKDLEPLVTSILETGGSGWEAALEGIGAQFSIDTVTCAVQYVRDLWAIHEGSGSAATVSLATNAKLVRAQQWLAAHGGK